VTDACGDLDMEEKERVAKDIRTAFELFKEKGSYRFGDIDLGKAMLCAGIYSELAKEIEVCGMKVYLCNLQSSYDYFLCINDPTKAEVEYLKYHIEAMQQNT
jgi:hypothetical protein